MNRVKYRSLVITMLAIMLALLSVAIIPMTKTSAAQQVEIIVQKEKGVDSLDLLRSAGGVLVAEIPLINGFIAKVPAANLAAFGEQKSVLRYSLNHPLQSHSITDTAANSAENANPVPAETSAPPVAEDGKGTPAAETPVPESEKPVPQEAAAAPVQSPVGDIKVPTAVQSIQPMIAGFKQRKEKIGKNNEFKKAGIVNNNYRKMVKVDKVEEKGRGVTIAVLDSGIGKDSFSTSQLNLIESAVINPEATTPYDTYGHGTHVAGIINAKGAGGITGIAPAANLIDVKLGNDNGELTEADLLYGLQWVYDFKDQYSIKAINLSVSSSVSQSYLASPISAAVEQLWLNGVTVIAAAGNDKVNPNDVNYAPANDPFVITVGAVDGNGKDKAKEATLASWSKRGSTAEGVAKPEVTAPGTDIVSLLPSSDAILAVEHPEAVLAGHFLQMSGTSMAAPVVTGTVALMLEANPSLTPNQIKAVLANTTQTYSGMTDNAGVIDAEKAVALAKDEQKLQSIAPGGYNEWPRSPYIGDNGKDIDYTKVSWNKVSWNKVSWNKVSWNKVSWNKVSWNIATQ
ncbi:S8 family serine peptidase [Aneurinibacillus tyrosinisolvens]|uniref:S8 family serine peptidase n=1 Tax=Aneurinibacillus tyrosinisolvens TaxID=1443435 RepID=UPI0006996BD4|nr:S8 family serine peptidase [Aneurinibacillus tyrosinisolvens]